MPQLGASTSGGSGIQKTGDTDIGPWWGVQWQETGTPVKGTHANFRQNLTDSYYTFNLALAPQYNMNYKPLSQTGQKWFVRGSARYLAELVQDDTGTIVGIVFTQVN
jgi:hypothetical protein